jgi:uncharacterized protein
MIHPLNKMLLATLLILLSLYATGCVGLYFVQDDMIFPGKNRPPTPIPNLPPATQILHREFAPGQNVEAWYFPAPNASKEHPAPLAVLFHGNGERIDDMADAVQHFNAFGWAVLLPEYRGYNRSAGSPSQAAIHEDAAHFLNETLTRPEINPKRIVYYGRSLGGGVACDLTTAHMPQGLILTSTFISVAKIAQGYLAPEFLLNHPFHNDTVLESFPGPVLISHGTNDTIIPVTHSQTLAKLAKHPTYHEYNSNHNDFPGSDQAYDRYWATVRMFLATVPTAE